jgi:hypothetical protein
MRPSSVFQAEEVAILNFDDKPTVRFTPYSEFIYDGQDSV